MSAFDTEGWATMFHAVGATWTPGDPLVPRDDQTDPEPWKWADDNDSEPFDGDCVSLTPDFDEAAVIGGGELRVVAVRVHRDEVRRDRCGYPAVYGQVSADRVTLLPD